MRNFGMRGLASGVLAAAAVFACAGQSFAEQPGQPAGVAERGVASDPQTAVDVDGLLHRLVIDSGLANTGSYRPECWGEGETPCMP
jgi:hypothetical protein